MIYFELCLFIGAVALLLFLEMERIAKTYQEEQEGLKKEIAYMKSRIEALEKIYMLLRTKKSFSNFSLS